MTTMIQVPQALIDQEKADPDLPLPTARTPTGTSHSTTGSRTSQLHGRDLHPCAFPTRSATLVINPHYQTPSTRRSTSQCMTIGGQVFSQDNDATTYLAKAAVLFASTTFTTSRMKGTFISKFLAHPLTLNGLRFSNLTNSYTSLNLQKKTPSNTSTKNPPRTSPGSTTLWTSKASTSRTGLSTSCSFTT